MVARGSMSLVVRGGGLVESAEQVEGIFVKSVAGTPVYLRDLAAVGADPKEPNGVFAKDGGAEGVEGIVLMRRGENPAEVLARVKSAVADLNDGVLLPSGIKVASYYDRWHLIHAALGTVATAHRSPSRSWCWCCCPSAAPPRRSWRRRPSRSRSR